MIKNAEPQAKSSSELNQKLVELLKEQFNLRMRKSTGQLKQSHLLKSVKRDIARVKTVLSQKVGE